mmetsp:Transcript_24549/g.17266  ORF Transcript_24549/g.17266 Transcript_24549/m.17266 type:complete len:302 (-) Transcript_24549:104-1009(-)
MTTTNFYTSNMPEYYWQKPHWNLGNKLVHNDLYKKLNPVHQRYYYTPNEYSQLPYYFGVVPQGYWLYSNLDYSFNKHHRHIQTHDDWYPDRKNKTLGVDQGGQNQPIMQSSKYMTLVPTRIPRGCYKEIRKYKKCSADKGSKACFNEKIDIMEVCPDHILEGLREKKKWSLRAEVIDNQTYKRAMTVGSYNKGRSVSELKLRTWDEGSLDSLRSDSLYQDDRYDPTKFSHPHRYDNVNFPEQEYKDFFGGTVGTAESEEYERHRIDLFSGTSKAMREHATEKKFSKLKDAAKDVKDLNKQE